MYISYAIGLSLYFCFLPFCFFPLPPSLGCRLPSQTVVLQTAAGECLADWGGGSTFSSAGLKLSFLGSRPAGCCDSRQAYIEAVFLLYRLVVP